MRLIDEELVMEKVNECFDTCDQLDLHFTAQDVIDIIKSAPTVEAEPTRHGHWINGSFIIIGSQLVPEKICSVCGAGTIEASDFCGACGAKMDEEAKDE